MIRLYVVAAMFGWAALVGPACAADPPCAAAACVATIEVDGRAAEATRDVLLRRPNDARDESVELKPGAELADGSVIETRPKVRLQLMTRNGNRITLEPGSRLRLETTSERGESYAQLFGRARYAVTRALGFFEVSHERFLAAVKGTEFGVAIDEQRSEIRFEWGHGTVQVEREVDVRIAEQDAGDADDGEPPATGGKRPAAGGGTDAADTVVIERDTLSDTQRELRYRLAPDAYLREFRSYGDAERYFREQLARDERSGDAAQVRRALLDLGTILNAVGKPRAALEVLQRALGLAASAQDERLEAQLMRRVGLVYRDLDDPAKSTEMLRRWLALEERRAGGDATPGIAFAHVALGRTAGAAGDARGWVASVERAAAILKRLDPDEQTPATAALYKNLADAYWAAGERDKSMRVGAAALELKRKLQPDGVNWAIANSQRDLGLRHLQMGRFDTAIDYLQQALDGRSRLFNGTHPSVAHSYDDLGRAYERKGDAAAAAANFEKALALRLQLFPDGVHPGLVRSYVNLGRVARARGDAKAAQQYQEQAREVRRKLQR